MPIEMKIYATNGDDLVHELHVLLRALTPDTIVVDKAELQEALDAVDAAPAPDPAPTPPETAPLAEETDADEGPRPAAEKPRRGKAKGGEKAPPSKVEEMAAEETDLEAVRDRIKKRIGETFDAADRDTQKAIIALVEGFKVKKVGDIPLEHIAGVRDKLELILNGEVPL